VRKPSPLSLLGLGSLLLYSLTLLPTVGHTGDTAKFQFVGYVLGIPHPPGYPLYMLLSWLWTHLVPVGEVAWRMNLLSAVCATAAVVLVAAAVGQVERRRWAVLAAAVLAVSKQFWMHAVIAEVYALLAVFVALVLLFTVRWHRTRQPRDLAVAVLIWGVALAHHPLILTVAPGLAAAVLVTDRTVLRDPRPWLAGAIGVAVGLGFYAYLLWRTADPATPYVEVTATDLGSLLYQMRGGHFTGQMFAFSLAEVLEIRLFRVLEILLNQLGPLVFLAAAGLVRLARGLRWFVLATVAANVFVMVNYAITDLAVYILPTVLVLALPLASGCEQLAAAAARRGRPLHPAWFWILPAALLGANLGIANKADDTSVPAAIEPVLQQMGDHAVIVEPWYVRSQYLWYYLLADHYQRDHDLTTVRTSDMAEIAAYVQDGVPLRSDLQRRTLPPGLAVYTLMPDWADALAEQGCTVTRLGDNLYRVAAP